jgi:hypothetical protein
MTVEGLKIIFDWTAVILLFLTFAAGVGVLITGDVINKRQEQQLRQFDSDLTAAKSSLATQQERAANADARVAGLEQNAADAKTEMAKQETRAATAERRLMELQERIKPRRLTDEQAKKFVEALRTFPVATVRVGWTVGGADESFSFLRQLIPLFKEAGWTVVNDGNGISEHLDIQVIGIGILVHHELIPPGLVGVALPLTPTTAAIRRAFSAVGMDAQLLAWPPADADAPEVVVGSKPQTAP